jgi:uncharacterized protein (TIGR02246 family)
MTDLEALIARESIRDLLARYCAAFDDADWSSWEQIWTDDLVWEVNGDALVGLDAVRSFMTTRLPVGYRGKHLCSNPVISLAPDGRTATAETDVIWITQNFATTIVGRYVDSLVNRDDRWLIARREEWTVPRRRFDQRAFRRRHLRRRGQFGDPGRPARQRPVR